MEREREGMKKRRSDERGGAAMRGEDAFCTLAPRRKQLLPTGREGAGRARGASGNCSVYSLILYHGILYDIILYVILVKQYHITSWPSLADLVLPAEVRRAEAWTDKQACARHDTERHLASKRRQVVTHGKHDVHLCGALRIR